MRFEEIVENFKREVGNKEVTRNTLNEYFTELFEYELETPEDLDEMNKAESYLEELYLKKGDE